jgi:transposase InsO family protein
MTHPNAPLSETGRLRLARCVVDDRWPLRRAAERFHRTLADEWAYARPYRSERERREALPAFLHWYNHHRGHTALGGNPPATRVPNLTGQYN